MPIRSNKPAVATLSLRYYSGTQAWIMRNRARDDNFLALTVQVDKEQVRQLEKAVTFAKARKIPICENALPLAESVGTSVNHGR